MSCYLYVHSLVNEKIKSALPAETPMSILLDLQSRAAATVFVDVAKAGVVATWNPKLKHKQFPPTPTDPKLWAECYIDSPKSALHGKTLAEISEEELVKLFTYYDEQKANHALAECVYQAAQDRKVLEPEIIPAEGPDDHEGAESDDDVPF